MLTNIIFQRSITLKAQRQIKCFYRLSLLFCNQIVKCCYRTLSTFLGIRKDVFSLPLNLFVCHIWWIQKSQYNNAFRVNIFTIHIYIYVVLHVVAKSVCIDMLRIWFKISIWSENLRNRYLSYFLGFILVERLFLTLQIYLWFVSSEIWASGINFSTQMTRSFKE